MQNVNVQRKRNPGDTDKNGIISEYREILREAGCLSQTVDKALLLQGFAIVGAAFLI